MSQNNNLPRVQHTPRNLNLDSNSSINHLVEAIAGIATRQLPQTSTMLKPVSTDTLFVDGESKKNEISEDLIHIMHKTQSELTHTMKINDFHAQLRKEALQTFKNKSAGKLLVTC